jgi:3'-phosphoadenosine 5'-phosphosulfate sulfotransferase (PAPS reductase)/FAD synthetase
MATVTYIASVSGGKDSTAMCLHLRELGLPFRAVFFDTGWEHADTYRYVRESLPDAIGQPVEIRYREPVLDERREAMAAELEAMLGWRSPMVRWVLKRGMFPSRTRRFCTQELKYFTARDVMREAHAAGLAPVNVLGIRADESVARSKLLERELDEDLDAMVWRPLLRWTVDDVIAIHQRHGVIPNPMYLRNANRVGCWPCIMAGKAELRLLSKDEPRIRVIERLEAMVGQLAQERHDARGEVLERPPAFFQGNRSHGVQNEDGSWSIPCIPIRRHIEWALTDRGGSQMLLDLPDDSGCMRWGLCDLPVGAP